jgi:hypothetical protein
MPLQAQTSSQAPTQALSNKISLQAPQPLLSLSQQKLAMLTSMENEISSMRVALNRIEASIKELQL